MSKIPLLHALRLRQPSELDVGREGEKEATGEPCLPPKCVSLVFTCGRARVDPCLLPAQHRLSFRKDRGIAWLSQEAVQFASWHPAEFITGTEEIHGRGGIVTKHMKVDVHR